MAVRGTHMSWRERFIEVGKALRGVNWSESDLMDKWIEAKTKNMSGPDAYTHLVDLLFSEATVLQGGSTHIEQAGAHWTPVKVRWLPLYPAGICARAQRVERKADEGFPNPICKHPDHSPDYQYLPRWCLKDAGGHAKSCSEEPASDHFIDKKLTVWIEDIPARIGNAKQLVEVLHACKPASMPTPCVKRLVSKVDTPERLDPRHRSEPLADDVFSEGKSCLGYALVMFRDESEAAEAVEIFDGMRVAGDWTIRARLADARDQSMKKEGRRYGPRLSPGCNPSIGEQLFSDRLHEEQLTAALERHRQIACSKVEVSSDAWVVVELIKAYYRQHPRREIMKAGALVPNSLLQPLLTQLRMTRWPVSPHRWGMQAEQYMVLHRGQRNDGYDDLLALSNKLLDWADPAFGCNRIAITKDFQGSPHIDYSDVTYQYAISLGGFTTGGELCVEGRHADEVYVVNTHDRLARVDGRFMHWVKGHAGGDRYSLIFFSTTSACATERQEPFHEDFVPHGSAFSGICSDCAADG